MNTIKKVGRSTKDFVVRHRTGLAFAALVAVHVNVVRKHNEFLKEHDLFDTYYEI